MIEIKERVSGETWFSGDLLETADEEEDGKYRRLWSAVILQALNDASGNDQKARSEARSWLTGNSQDFRAVCEMAA
jgi:hypothetical protein